MATHQLDNLSSNDLLRYNTYSKPNDHQVYLLSDELKDAVKVAIMLQQPLLITGEPGTGKTALAYKVAAELHRISNGLYRDEPFFFTTKSNSSASDLFYTYDAISHFFDANISKGLLNSNADMNTGGTWKYITLQAFGKAIINTLPDNERTNVQAVNSNETGGGSARNAVVLIDEIDKASRDFPNDILNEIDKYRFSIKETGFTTYEKAPGAHILLIMTSNSEKALPEPFLRRCVFYHIPFPDAGQLTNILGEHRKFFHASAPASDELISWASEKFIALREVCKEKKPATAELISWLRYLAENKFNPKQPDKTILKGSLSTVIKNSDDLARAADLSWM